MKTRMTEGLSGATQQYLAVPYLFPAPIRDATRTCNHQPRCGDPHLRPLWSVSWVAWYLQRYEQIADVLWPEETDSTQLCLHLQTADLSHSPGKSRGLSSPEIMLNKDPGMRHCRPAAAVWTRGWGSYWRLSDVRHTWPEFHRPLYLLTSGYLQRNLFAAAQSLPNCVVASAALGLGTCWGGPW